MPQHREELQALRTTLREWCRRRGADEARACAERGATASLTRWSELADLGVFGAHLPESAGGSGFGLAGGAAVLEELAYWLIPGPIQPTLLASELLRHHHCAETDGLLRGLADGSLRAAVCWTGARATAEPIAGTLLISGDLGPVLGAPDADLLLLVVELAGSQVCCVVDLHADGIEVQALPGLDPTRSVGTVRLRRSPIPQEWTLPGLTPQTIAEHAAVLVAAESAGIAAWTLDTAVTHAKTRVQFGRPIGAFQAVNHHCVDMLVSREQAGAVAWRAVRESHTTELPIASAVAACVAPQVAYDSTKTCIQVLGAIGFSWEHGAHLRLRRAVANRQLVGPLAEWRHRLVEQSRRSATHDRPQEASRAAEASPAVLPDKMHEDVRRVAAAQHGESRRLLADCGLLAPALPHPYGLEATPAVQLALRAALHDAGVVIPDLVIGKWALATLAAAGTDEQRVRFVMPTLRGEIAWCQLFSEPEAGSDLASLRTSATRVDGGWTLTGHKIWTSRAAEADWAICLARVREGAADKSGITFFLVPMRTPGIDVRPLRNAVGEYRFNEVFLDGVFVADDLVVGEIGDGWRVARTTLSSERVEMSQSRFGTDLDVILALLGDHERDDHDGTALRDAEIEVGGLIAEARTLDSMAAREAEDIGAGASRPGAAEVRKLTAMSHYQRSTEVAMQLLGHDAMVVVGSAEQISHDFLETRGLTIGGGTTEVLKTAVGERVLGLPRGRSRA
jgi:alkylation response protein AidB-like acyl-CoA dehydrogenase